MDSNASDRTELEALRQMVYAQQREINALSARLNRRSQILRWLKWPAILAVILLILTIPGTAIAAIPDSGGAFTGCYQQHTGQLRLIDLENGQACLPNETQVSWNQAGVPGLSHVHVVIKDSDFNQDPVKSAYVMCPDGEVAVGGGILIFPSLADPNYATAPVFVRSSVPILQDYKDYKPVGWSAAANVASPYGYDWWIHTYAVCAIAAP